MANYINCIEKISGAYKTGIYAIANSDTKAIQIGNSTNPEFYVTGKGVLNATNATITGTINADTGKIGGTNGFTIDSKKIYTGSKSTSTSNTNGLYLGTDGISLGKGFKVDNQGNVNITQGSINIGNDNFIVSTSGNVYFKGNIQAYYSGSDYTGVDSSTISIQGVSGYTNVKVVKGLIVGIKSS